jgi:hypothetical protein
VEREATAIVRQFATTRYSQNSYFRIAVRLAY